MLHHVKNGNAGGGVPAQDLLAHRLGGGNVALAEVAGKNQNVHGVPSLKCFGVSFRFSIAKESFARIKGK